MNLSFTLCPKSIAALPSKGRSAFVRAAILAFGKSAPASEGLPKAASMEPVAWQRSWHRPARDFPDGFDMTTLIWDKARKVFLNTPPWPAFPSLDMEQARSWGLYVDSWRFPDPFPGPLEWLAMGEPLEPLPEHRVVVEPSEESPPPAAVLPVVEESPPPVSVLPVEPLPVVVPAPSQESPPAAAGVSSSNILEEV